MMSATSTVPTKTKTAVAQSDVHHNNIITTPHDHDIIKGRGGGVNKHAGNVRFRMWVDARKARYALSRVKAEKGLIAQEVIDLVKSLSPPGRFLKLMDSNNNSGSPSSSSSSTYWIEMDAEAALTKVSQALREGAPVIRLQEKQDLDDPNVVPFKQHTIKPIKLPALGQQRPNALLSPPLKHRKSSTGTNATGATDSSLQSQPSIPATLTTTTTTVQDKSSSHKRRMHPGSEMSPSAVAGQQDIVRQQMLQQQQAEAKAPQQKSPKRSKPNPKAAAKAGDVAATAAAAAVVPGSPVQQDEQDYASPEEEEQQKRSAATTASSGSGKKGVGNGASRKRSATKTKTDNSDADNNKSTKNVPPTTSLLLIQRLDQLEERQGDLESQLLEEKKHRLKQEQRQGALELQLLEAKSMRMKQDDAIKRLRRELAQLQQQQPHQRTSYSTAAAPADEEEDDGENSHASEGACLV